MTAVVAEDPPLLDIQRRARFPFFQFVSLESELVSRKSPLSCSSGEATTSGGIRPGSQILNGFPPPRVPIATANYR
jgi:hypothetical protein